METSVLGGRRIFDVTETDRVKRSTAEAVQDLRENEHCDVANELLKSRKKIFQNLTFRKKIADSRQKYLQF